MTKFVSRARQVDIDKCAESAGGRFDLVIMAAARSREIRRQHQSSPLHEHQHSNITALLEFQNGELDQTYMEKIKFDDKPMRKSRSR